MAGMRQGREGEEREGRWKRRKVYKELGTGIIEAVEQFEIGPGKSSEGEKMEMEMEIPDCRSFCVILSAPLALPKRRVINSPSNYCLIIV